MEDYQFPKGNDRKLESRKHQQKINLEIRLLIEKYEKEVGYKFLSYEIDNVLLAIVKKNHEGYLITKFGYDIEWR